MDKTFSEQVHRVLFAVWENGDDPDGHRGISTYDAQQAILALLKERIPEQRERSPLTEKREYHEIGGWNYYRSQLLKNLGMEE